MCSICDHSSYLSWGFKQTECNYPHCKTNTQGKNAIGFCNSSKWSRHYIYALLVLPAVSHSIIQTDRQTHTHTHTHTSLLINYSCLPVGEEKKTNSRGDFPEKIWFQSGATARNLQMWNRFLRFKKLWSSYECEIEMQLLGLS